jgi:hypothetical protein
MQSTLRSKFLWLGSPYASGVVVLIASGTASHYARRFGIQHVGLVVGSVTSTFIGILIGARMRRRQENIDSYQAHTYYQNLKIRGAVQVLSGIMDLCPHSYEADHEQCRAAMRKQLLVIKAAMGQAPIPEIILGNLRKNAASVSR